MRTKGKRISYGSISSNLFLFKQGNYLQDQPEAVNIIPHFSIRVDYPELKLMNLEASVS
jgi:hypothetical protein